MVFSPEKLSVAHTVSFIHPEDRRPVFISPWEGGVLLGTTDQDHEEDLNLEPRISSEEVRYLLDGLHHFMPTLKISASDCISTLSGVRPVLSEGKLPPSKESRDSVVWVDKGLLTVTGGKLTTFRKMAVDTLKAAKEFIKEFPKPLDETDPVFARPPEADSDGNGGLTMLQRRLWGRYGAAANELLEKAGDKDLEIIPGTETIWAELPHAAEKEQIRHLSDLLLRRVRIGLLTPRGGRAYLGRIKKLCRPFLPWSRKRWRQEITAYNDLWEAAHTIPAKMTRELYERQPPSITEFREFFRFYVRKIFST